MIINFLETVVGIVMLVLIAIPIIFILFLLIRFISPKVKKNMQCKKYKDNLVEKYAKYDNQQQREILRELEKRKNLEDRYQQEKRNLVPGTAQYRNPNNVSSLGIGADIIDSSLYKKYHLKYEACFLEYDIEYLKNVVDGAKSK